MLTKQEMMEVANTIWHQISAMTKMACGAREALAIDNGLRFKVAGKQRYVKVELNEMDTYNVEYFVFKMSGKHGNGIEVLGSEIDIYADQLSDVIYRMVHK